MNTVLGVLLLVTTLAILWKRVIFRGDKDEPISKPIIYLAGGMLVLGLLFLGGGQIVAEFIAMVAEFVKGVIVGARG
jgi:hypothetical protein